MKTSIPLQFPTLNRKFNLSLKEPKELINILSDHGFKIPDDDYYVKSIINESNFPNSPIFFLIGKKYVVRYRDSINFSVFLRTEIDDHTINEIIKGKYYNDLKTYSNPIGFASWYFKSNKRYYINGEEITKNKFTTHLVKQRTKALK